MLIRKRAKSKTSSVPAKPKIVGGGEIGSSYVPGSEKGGSWLLPDSARNPLERIEDADGRVLWRPRRN